MILEKFYTNNNDEGVALIHYGRAITFGELKKYVSFQKKVFEKDKKNSVVLLGDNCFEFVVNFFAALFSNKDIYLLTDKNRLSTLKIDYILPESPQKDEDCFIEETEIKSKIVFYTSGSTSEPKTIVKKFEHLENESEALSNQFIFDKNTKVYSTTIMSHMFGLTFHFMLPLYTGMVINTEKVEFPEQITEEKPYILVSSPSFLEKMSKYDVDFSYYPKRIITAGDKLNDSVYEFFNKKSDIIEIYGSTETGVIAFKNNSSNFRKFNNVSFSVADDGCIVVKSNMFDEEEIKMEDVIEKLSDDEFLLKGRNDRMVKIKEKRVSLVELESKLKEHPQVFDAYCFKFGEVLACAIVTSDYSLDKKILKDYLSKYSEVIPKKWRFLDEIPKTDTGKIDKKDLEQIFSMNLSYPFIVSKKVTENTADIELQFRKKSNFFQGHFPVMPILPGVVQLFYANYFAKKVFKIEIPETEAKRIKFTNIIRADEKVTLSLKKNEKNVEYAYVVDDKVFSSGIFVL